jgi:uncharacterized protein (DUF58 family)
MSLLKLGKDNWARTSPTKLGILYIALTLFVGFAAINTGNNLLYLTFGMMLSFVIVSGIISMFNLARIDVDFKVPRDIYALSPANLIFTLTNKKPLIPSYSLTIDLNGRKTFVPYLKRDTKLKTNLRYIFNKRGWNSIPDATISTSFPFGFFKKWIRIDLGKKEVLVYPKIEKVDISADYLKEKKGSNEIDRKGFGTDLRSIKDFKQGDNPKFIHWKVSAKKNKLMVREMHDEESESVTLQFNPTKNKGELERQIVQIASTLMELLNKNYVVDFISPQKTYPHNQIGNPPREVLSYLALYDN